MIFLKNLNLSWLNYSLWLTIAQLNHCRKNAKFCILILKLDFLQIRSCRWNKKKVILWLWWLKFQWNKKFCFIFFYWYKEELWERSNFNFAFTVFFQLLEEILYCLYTTRLLPIFNSNFYFLKLILEDFINFVSKRFGFKKN